MKVFVVVSPDAEKIGALVQAKFSERNYELAPGVWTVAVGNMITVDVCNALGMNSEGGVAGVVFPMNRYAGYFHVPLWETLELWSGR